MTALSDTPLKKLPEELFGDLVTLKAPALSFAPELFNLVEANREHLRPWMPWERLTNSESDSLDFLQSSLVKWQTGSSFNYMLCHPETGELVGTASAFALDWENKTAELGYWVGGKFTQKGYGRDAVATLENALFILGINRLEIRPRENNIASAAVATSSGYTLEGILREHVWQDGQVFNTKVFSKLKSEWPQ